jgi:phospholipid/cholesterol/gamma-HCH transport system substrate-binding protein
MAHARTIEIWVGIFVALGIAALAMLSMKVSNLTNLYESPGYIVTANFRNIGGLKVKSPVTMAGVKIGRVVEIGFDDSRYEAAVKIKIDGQYDKIPLDSDASIYTAGLLGEQYIGLQAGGEEEYLADGSVISITQSAVILEQIVSKLVYSIAEGGAGK